jgi:hypothetical protein
MPCPPGYRLTRSRSRGVLHAGRQGIGNGKDLGEVVTNIGRPPECQPLPLLTRNPIPSGLTAFPFRLDNRRSLPTFHSSTHLEFETITSTGSRHYWRQLSIPYLLPRTGTTYTIATSSLSAPV